MPLIRRVPRSRVNIVKIDSSYKPSIAGSTPPPSRKASDTSSTSSDSTEVHLSATAAQLASDSTPPVNVGRIAEIRQAIAEGRFKINADAIADSLIASAQEMLSNRRAV